MNDLTNHQQGKKIEENQQPAAITEQGLGSPANENEQQAERKEIQSTDEQAPQADKDWSKNGESGFGEWSVSWP